MTLQIHFCPGGADSQSGAAIALRYPQTKIASCGGIPDVPSALDQNIGPYTIPIWNSHEGEVTAADYVWDYIEKSKIYISDIWAKRIEFLFLKRRNPDAVYGKIGSVRVAATQCSIFLDGQGCEFVRYGLTTIAFTGYNNGDKLDGVLVAPNQPFDANVYEIITSQTANPNNFTSFITFTRSDSPSPPPHATTWLTGVSMSAFSATVSEAEASFFRNLVSEAEEIDRIPKLAFVFKRDAKVGLLFEGEKLYRGDLLDAEEMERGDISIYEEAGSMAKGYGVELKELFAAEFKNLTNEDFILHKGVNSCLFICPPLGLYTHGYEVETVEPIIRFFISELFRIWDNSDIACSELQTEFFQRHKLAWEERQSDFIDFKIVESNDRGE